MSILFYYNRKDHGDSRRIMKTAPGCLEDRTQGSDQWEAEGGTADAGSNSMLRGFCPETSNGTDESTELTGTWPTSYLHLKIAFV